MANEAIRDGNEIGGSYEDYLVARLALWAGDTEEATWRLENYRSTRTKSVLTDLAAASAQKTLRQLKRRLSEYESIYAACDFRPGTTGEHVLNSEAGIMRGVIWVEGDREFELRAYLRDTTLEEQFYWNAARLHRSTIRQTTTETYLRYGLEPIALRDLRQDPKLNLEWVVEGDCFLQVAVSDFCTFCAHSTWTLQDLPMELAQITKPFQLLLNEFDVRLDLPIS